MIPKAELPPRDHPYLKLTQGERFLMIPARERI
jgi:hypothetical protein